MVCVFMLGSDGVCTSQYFSHFIKETFNNITSTKIMTFQNRTNQKYIGRVPKRKINAVPMLYSLGNTVPGYLRPFSFATFQTIIVFFPGLNH